MESLVVRSQQADWNAVPGQGAAGLRERWLLRTGPQSPNFDVRHVIIRPASVSKDHSHPWEQANYVLSGSGRVTVDGESVELGPGDFVFFPSNCRHCFHNASETEPLVLLCMHGPKDDVERN